jgi:hypothetical protein
VRSPEKKKTGHHHHRQRATRRPPLSDTVLTAVATLILPIRRLRPESDSRVITHSPNHATIWAQDFLFSEQVPLRSCADSCRSGQPDEAALGGLVPLLCSCVSMRAAFVVHQSCFPYCLHISNRPLRPLLSARRRHLLSLCPSPSFFVTPVLSLSLSL